MTAKKEPGRVPQELINFFESKGLRPAWSYREVWGQEHLNSFTVAGAMEKDILSDIHKAVIEAQTQGLPFEQFARDLAPVLESKGWFAKIGLEDDPDKGKDRKKARSRRLETIYQTNLRMARSHGQWERIQRRKAVQPALRYRLGPSAKHRVEHVALDGLVYPVDHPFWRTHMPPNAWGCNCWVEALTAAQARDAGGYASELDPRLFPPETYRDPRDGKKRETPFGVDPGFEFAPGLGGRRQALAQKKAGG